MEKEPGLKIVDAFDLDPEVRSLLKPQETAEGKDGRRHQLPRYFYEIPSHEAARDTRLSAHFEMFVPSGRAISPITKTNWEGTGVEPDVKVEEAKALSTAHTMALEKLLESATDPRRREALQDALDSVMGGASTAASAR